jgi:iron(III) transport system permease protein
VTLPQASWSLGIAALAVFILAMTLRTVTDVLSVRVFAEEVLTQFSMSGKPWGAACLALPAVVLLGAVAALGIRILRGHGRLTGWAAMRLPFSYRLGAVRFPAAAAGVCLTVLFFGLPVASLAAKTGSFENMATAYRSCSEELWITLMHTSIAATLCVLLAAPLAWQLTRSGAGRFVIIGLLLLMVATPAPIVGIGLVHLLNQNWMPEGAYRSPLPLIIAYVIRTLPFAVLAVLPSIRRIPAELEEAAQLDGCDATDRFLAITLPLSWRGLLVAWFMAFVLSIGENGAAIVVVPPGTTVLAVRFFTLVHGGLQGSAAGICLVLLTAVILPAAVLAGLLWRLLRIRLA